MTEMLYSLQVLISERVVSKEFPPANSSVASTTGQQRWYESNRIIRNGEGNPRRRGEAHRVRNSQGAPPARAMRLAFPGKRMNMYKYIACLGVLLLAHGWVFADPAPASAKTGTMVSSSASIDTAAFASIPASVQASPAQKGPQPETTGFKNPTPEPSSLVLLSLVGLAGGFWRRRRMRK